MAFTGYSNSGAAEYNIGSQRGIDFVSNASAGSSITGGDGSVWTKNADGTTSIKRGSDSWTVGNALGNLQNTLDTITAQSDKTSARSNDYAREARDWSASQAAIANNFNAYEAQKNRDWQELMSNTAHQREVADLKAAGLNPVLSAMGGNGASVTSGATAQSVMPDSHAGESSNASGAIASVLSSILAAQTSLQNQAMSARTQEAIADKYTATSHLIAELNNATSLSNARLASETSKYSADSANAASRYSADSARASSKYAADSSAAASRYASDNAKFASMFSAEQSSSASRYAAEQSRAASKYASDNSRAASMYSSDSSYAATRYSADKHSDFWPNLSRAFGSNLGDYFSDAIGDLLDIFG